MENFIAMTLISAVLVYLFGVVGFIIILLILGIK